MVVSFRPDLEWPNRAGMPLAELPPQDYARPPTAEGPSPGITMTILSAIDGSLRASHSANSEFWRRIQATILASARPNKHEEGHVPSVSIACHPDLRGEVEGSGVLRAHEGYRGRCKAAS